MSDPDSDRRSWNATMVTRDGDDLEPSDEYAGEHTEDNVPKTPRKMQPAPGELTSAQREALNLAYRRGFFEIPRRVTYGELAEELGISDQAVSERIRRGQRNLIEASNDLNGGVR